MEEEYYEVATEVDVRDIEKEEKVRLEKIEQDWREGNIQAIQSCKSKDELMKVKVACLRCWMLEKNTAERDLSDVRWSDYRRMELKKIQEYGVQEKFEGEMITTIKWKAFDFICPVCEGGNSVFVRIKDLQLGLKESIKK